MRCEKWNSAGMLNHCDVHQVHDTCAHFIILYDCGLTVRHTWRSWCWLWSRARRTPPAWPAQTWRSWWRRRERHQSGSCCCACCNSRMQWRRRNPGRERRTPVWRLHATLAPPAWSPADTQDTQTHFLQSHLSYWALCRIRWHNTGKLMRWHGA